MTLTGYSVQGEFIPSTDRHRPKYHHSGIYVYDGDFYIQYKLNGKPASISTSLIGIFKDELKKSGFPKVQIAYGHINTSMIALQYVKQVDTRHFVPAFLKAVNKFQAQCK